MKRSNRIWIGILGGVMSIGILTATVGPRYWKHRVSHFKNCTSHKCDQTGKGVTK